MSIFEVLMLLCFGSAWPFSIYTSYKTRTAKGKSLFFLVVIFIGYFSGIMHKIFYSFDYVIILYMLNFVMIGIDIVLYFRNKQLDKKKANASSED